MTGKRSKATDIQSVVRLRRLRDAGVPAMVPSNDAWCLSGGVLGDRTDAGTMVPLALIAKRVPDCTEFLADYLEGWHRAS